MISFKETSDNTREPRKWVTPGIREVQVIGFELTKAGNGNDVILGKFIDISTDDEHTENFPCTTDIKPGKKKSAFELTQSKIKHISRACLTDEQYNEMINMEVETMDSFVNMINGFLVGKSYRQKFTGEEKMSQSNRIYAISRIPLNFPMAEPLTTNPSGLSFDKENPSDYIKYVQVALNSPTPTPMPVTPGNDGLPF